MSARTIRNVFSVAFVLMLAHAASAHPGHGAETGIAAGAAHPISGIDHILAMIAVGICAAQMGGRSRWLLPLTFLASMCTAGFVAMGGVQVPMVEQGIAASILVLGLLIAAGSQTGRPIMFALAALFGGFHGFAHGAELQPGVGRAEYAIGFLLATAVLHAVGFGVGMLLQKRPQILVRATGAAVAVCGLFIFLIGMMN